MSSADGSARVERQVFPLISAADLHAMVAAGPPPVVLDIRWTLAGADLEGYLAGHIPGAVFVDLDADLAGPPGEGGRHPLPDVVTLQRFWRSVGVSDDTSVVVYDGSDSAPAARAWWLLRWSGLVDARVLDGGLEAWRAAGFPVVTGDQRPPAPGTMTVRPGSMPTVGVDDVARGGPLVVVDARAANRYRGEVEPIDPVAGHIPGAVNLPYLGLLDGGRRLRDSPAVAAAFDEVGVRPGTEAAASCGSGVSACVLVLAAATAGLTVALYPGSYSQWCALGREVSRQD